MAETKTRRRKPDWVILPGPEGQGVGGYGWRQDQSCFFRAGYYSDWHVGLAGQDTVIVNAGIDGFLTRLPNGAKVLMRRGTTGMPELAMYDYSTILQLYDYRMMVLDKSSLTCEGTHVLFDDIILEALEV